MNKSLDKIKTLEIIERLKLAKIGNYKKWESIVEKIKKDTHLNSLELEYFSNLTRIYKDSIVTKRTRIYHVKLSEYDERPPCQICGDSSEYYCNMNDQYFCMIHVVGHDDNEI